MVVVVFLHVVPESLYPDGQVTVLVVVVVFVYLQVVPDRLV